MRSPRRIAAIAGIVVLALVVALALLPLLFQDRIAARLKATISESVDARVAWSDVRLSVLRHFPNASLGVDGLTVAGVRRFVGDTLLAVSGATLVLDLGSVVRYLTSGGNIVVRELTFDHPVVRLRRLADGTANWNITKSKATSDTSSSALNLSLRRLRIDDGAISADDRQSNFTAAALGLSETLSGDFAKEQFTLATRTRIDTLSVSFAGIPYLRRVALDLDADIGADTRAHRFTFAHDTLRVNKLLLAVSGAVTTSAPDIGLDLSFAAPGTSFAEILSLVPAVYAKDFDRIRTSGTMSVSGRVRGNYGPKAFPSLAIRARVENASFQYPDLPLPARDIALDLAIDNPGGHVDSTVVDLKRFHAQLGSRPIDARLLVRTPVSDPDASIDVNGSVDLADVARTVKLEGVSTLTGVVAADASTRARVSDVNARRYDRVAAAGTIRASRVNLKSSSLPHPIAVDTAALTLSPQAAQLTAFAGTIGNSDVRATGSLENLVGFVLHGEDLRGRAAVKSQHFDLTEWKSDQKTTEVIPVPPHVDFTLDAAAAKVTYGALSFANVQGTLEVKNQRVTMRNLTTDMLGGRVTATGYYETVNPAKPVFDMSLGLTTLDIPAAFTSLAMVQRLTPIAQYAQGHVSGTLSLAGLMGRDMSPVLSALAGKGDITTDGLALRGAPIMQKLSGALSLDRLQSPSLGAIHAIFDVADGRLHVKPFTANVGGIDLTTSGSNGIDQSLDYDLGIAVPRTLVGLPTGDAMQVRAKLTGTVTNPAVTTNFAGMLASAKQATQSAATEIATTTVNTAKLKADSAADAARAKARAEADRIVADAERQADSIRAAARTLADQVRRDAAARVDSLVAKASNPLAKIAARKAGDQVKQRADAEAAKALQSANARADSLVAQAKRTAAQRNGAAVPP